MKTKRPMDCYRAIRIVHGMFYGGLVLLLLLLMIAGSGLSPNGWMEAGILLGMLACFGSLLFGFVYLRCPRCNGSLMPGGRVPTRIPAYCSHCGAELTEMKD